MGAITQFLCLLRAANKYKKCPLPGRAGGLDSNASAGQQHRKHAPKELINNDPVSKIYFIYSSALNSLSWFTWTRHGDCEVDVDLYAVSDMRVYQELVRCMYFAVTGRKTTIAQSLF